MPKVQEEALSDNEAKKVSRHPRRQDKKSTQSKEVNVKPKKPYVDVLSCLLGCLLTSWLPSLLGLLFLMQTSCPVSLIAFPLAFQGHGKRLPLRSKVKVKKAFLACLLGFWLASWVPSLPSITFLGAFLALCRQGSKWTSAGLAEKCGRESDCACNRGMVVPRARSPGRGPREKVSWGSKWPP